MFDDSHKLAASHLLCAVDPFGPMHIAVDDGNMTDDDLDFVEGVMRKGGAAADEWELLRLLRDMTEEERIELWETADYGGCPDNHEDIVDAR
jgi:hypothetical protein